MKYRLFGGRISGQELHGSLIALRPMGSLTGILGVCRREDIAHWSVHVLACYRYPHAREPCVRS